MAKVKDSLKVLHIRGYRVTQPRKLVLQALEQAKEPLSPYDIQELLRVRGKFLNHVTIYRVLDVLCSLNLVHRVSSLGGFVKCTLGEEGGCHRFAVCQRCGSLQEFTNEALCQKENEVLENLGFHTEYHLSEAAGLCSKCHGA